MTWLFVLCMTCANYTGQVWAPPNAIPSEVCRHIQTILGADPPGPIDITKMTEVELGLFLGTDLARQAMSQRLMVKCLPLD